MIIDSLLDTDFYKFTMMQVVLHKLPGASVEYHFKCRTDDIDLRPFADEIKQEINHLCQLRFTREELDYLRHFSFFKSDFVEFLRIFQLNESFIEIVSNGQFSLKIKGPWLHTILFEVPILAIVAEVYARHHYPNADLTQGQKKLQDNIQLVLETNPVGGFKFSEFGTRRRFSKAWQDEVVSQLVEALPLNLTGTSNVYFAKKYGIKPIGTMAHEYLQACQAVGPRLLHSQKFAFETWAQEYRGELGIALSDIIGLDAFLRDFDKYLCKLFDGVRQDSGDPFIWGDRVIEHLIKIRVEPKTKSLVFTDCLTFEKAIEIYHYFKDRTNPVFGIGTHLTNDLGFQAMQNVIKMVRCNGQAVAKLSDTPEKGMCDDEGYLTYLKQVFSVTT